MLIVTLWVMVILGGLLTSLGYQVRVETALERRALEQSKLRWAARGAVHLACARLREHANDSYHSPLDDWWSDSQVYRERPLGEALVSLWRPSTTDQQQLEYGLDDAESRLNINTAEPEQLMGFPGVSTVLAEAIARYRRERQEQEEKGEPSPEGGEDRTKRVLIDGPIRSLRELLAVDGVTEQLLFGVGEDGRQPLARYLTSASSGRVNINSAPEAVLGAVGFSEGVVNLLLAQRRQGVVYRSLEDARSALDVAGDQGNKWQRLERFLTVRSSTFHLRALAVLAATGAEYNAEATVFTGEDRLLLTRWQEY